MTFAATNDTITGRFETEVATPQSLPTVYENETEDPPSNVLWARAVVREGQSFQADFGTSSHRRRTPGVFIVSLFGPLSRGTKDIMALADIVADKFTFAVVSGVYFQTASIERLGESDGEYQVNVSCPFFADDFVEVK